MVRSRFAGGEVAVRGGEVAVRGYVAPTVQTTSTNNVMCPGYCGEYLRPDWRFGMSGQRKYSMELRGVRLVLLTLR